jgi:hypothetical protein
MAGFAVNIEQFRLIDGYDNYEVSSHGRVRNNKTARILSQGLRSGYNSVILYKNSVGQNYTVHRLVAFAFCDNPDDYTVVDHIDRNKTNNMFNNLRWCTYSENNRNATISTKNTSGVQGVQKMKNSWQATWCGNDHKQHGKCFSIKTFGDEEAKELAIAHRKAKELEFGYM